MSQMRKAKLCKPAKKRNGRNATQNGAHSGKEAGLYLVAKRLPRYVHTGFVAYPKAALYEMGEV